MKTFLLSYFFILFTSLVWAQNSIGKVQLKNEELFYTAGNHAFIAGYKSGKVSVACVQTESGKITQTEFSIKGERFSSSFSFIGFGNFYTVQTFSEHDNHDLFNHIRIYCWNGIDPVQEFVFPHQLNNSVIRYALANDNEIYFLLDQQIVGFGEDELYRCRHQLMRFSRNEHKLHLLNYGLDQNRENNLCSFWFPLRIESDFTEWYRTKVRNKQFIYEVKRLDIRGNEISTKEIISKISSGVPEVSGPMPNRLSNIFFEFDAFANFDTVKNVRQYSQLATAPLRYVDAIDKYFTTSRVSAFSGRFSEGVYFMLLNKDLNVVKELEFPDLIRNPDLIKSIPDFMSAQLAIALSDSSVLINVRYLNFREKPVANMCYQLVGTEIKRVESPVSLEKLSGLYYPGFQLDMKNRAELKNVKPENLYKIPFVFTGKGLLYFVASQKEDEVYFIKL